ncbi:unnamed protein product [Owenia fusiformis]|uniref:Ribosome biogenesis protein WDR12 homolog n=1 Tax=Owenia fusiformis TaxID=6347 RepID=A0A8J1UGI9_OWEFU|nr:unnamed protein product [Owenia fusiformis]
METSSSHVQVKFFTKQDQYAVPDTPYSVPASVATADLSTLINGILRSSKSTGDEDEEQKIQFDFLIEGEFLRQSLEAFMDQKAISTETVVELEYLERHPAPKPEDSLLHDDWVSCLHGCGQTILSGCYDNTIKIWNTKGENLLTIPGHSAPVKCVAWFDRFEEDSLVSFVSGSHDQTLLLWQWDRNNNSVECVHTCRGHAGSVDCVAIDETKTRLCSGSWDRMLKIWSAIPSNEDEVEVGEKPSKKKKTDTSKIPTRVPLMTLSGHNEGISAAQWLSEQEVCTASWDHCIKIWDVEQGMEKSNLNGTKVFLDIDYSPHNKCVLAASSDRHIRLYDPRSTDGALVKCTFTSHTGWVSSVSWSPSNEHLFISGSYDSLVKMWDTRSPKAPLYDLSGHEDKVLAVDWSIPDLLLSGGADNSLKIFRHSDKSQIAVNDS